MPKTHEFVDYLLADVFRHISGVTAKAMFGGYCLYRNGLVFAIVDQDEGKVFIKATDSNREDIEELRLNKFVYTSKAGKTATMNYYQLPLEILENPDKIRQWVDKVYG